MKSFYITFGQVHTHRIPNKTLDKDIVVEIEAENSLMAQKKAIGLFGIQFARVLDEKPDMKFFPKGIVKI